jgi:hypothetical protein
MNVKHGKKKFCRECLHFGVENLHVLVENIARSFSVYTVYIMLVQSLNVTRNMKNAYTNLAGESEGGRLTYTAEMWVLKE